MELWEHQKEGLDAISRQPGTLLNMWMGTGKTKIVVEYIRRNRPRRTLIVCPLPVIPAWEWQLELHWGDGYELLLLNSGSSEKNFQKAQSAMRLNAMRPDKPLVMVINYESVWRNRMGNLLLRSHLDLVVADEIHRIKAAGGKASRYMSRLGARVPKRIGLTGTPLPHSPLDAYAQFRFLDPSIFGYSNTRFKQRYAIMGGFQGYQVVGYRNTGEFRKKFYSITVSADKDVLDLLPTRHVEVPLEMDAKDLERYNTLKREMVLEIREGRITVNNALVKLLRLQQLTSGYLPVDDPETDEPLVELNTVKAEALRELLTNISFDEPVVVFYRFVSDKRKIYEICSDELMSCGEVSGQGNDLKAWQAGSLKVLAVQIKSGSEGIDLTRARYAIYYSNSFSLGSYMQSLSRLDRPGQESHVVYYHLLVKGTIDYTLYHSLKKKAAVVKDILEAGKDEITEEIINNMVKED